MSVVLQGALPTDINSKNYAERLLPLLHHHRRMFGMQGYVETDALKYVFGLLYG